MKLLREKVGWKKREREREGARQSGRERAIEREREREIDEEKADFDNGIYKPIQHKKVP